MPIVSHSVARGSVLGVQRILKTVSSDAGSVDTYIPLFGKFRIIGVAFVPLVDQSGFTVSAQLFAPDGTTALTADTDIGFTAGDQIGALCIAPDNNLVDCESLPLVLTITNAAADTLSFEVLVMYSTALASDAGQYQDYLLNVSGQPIF